MTKSNNAALKASATTDLRARANRLRDDAGRFIKPDQPQPEALPDKMPGSRNTDAFRNEGDTQHEARRGHAEDQRRDPVATGRVPSGVQDMGRHEKFENAIPLVDDLLTGTMLGRSYHRADPGTELARAVLSYFGNDAIDPVLDGDIKLRNQARALLLAEVMPAKGPLLDADMLALGHQFDEAHEAWRKAVEANQEPSSRHDAFLAAAEKRGRITMKDHEEASALPGVAAAGYAEDDAFGTVADLGLKVLRSPANSITGLSIQARAVIPHIWAEGTYEEEGKLGADEDINKEAVRLLIESCCAAAGVDWRGQPRAEAPDSPDAPMLNTDRHDYAFHAASTELRLATYDHERLVNPSDDVWVEQNGGDPSDEAMAPAVAARNAAAARQDQAWRDLFMIRPRTWHQLWMMLRDVAENFHNHQGMEDEPDVFGALIGAVNGLRISSKELTATHDLSLLSINHLEYLADICRHQSRVLEAFEANYSEKPLGVVLDAESNRLAILGDHARDEIARRRPTDEFDRNLRLESMIKGDLAGNGYIEPALLAEAVAAWGA